MNFENKMANFMYKKIYYSCTHMVPPKKIPNMVQFGVYFHQLCLEKFLKN